MPISRRDFLLTAFRVSLGTGLAVAGAGLYATCVETIWLAVGRVRVPLPHLPPAFEGYRIAQLTDIHLGRTVTQTFIACAVDLTLRLVRNHGIHCVHNRHLSLLPINQMLLLLP